MGAHAALLVRVRKMALKNQFVRLVFLVYLVLSSHAVISGDAADADILLKFKNSLQNASALSNWNPSTPPCSGDQSNWNGVLCSKEIIWGLQLEKMSLQGIIDLDSLKELKDLRSISFSENLFNGPLPDIKTLGALKSVFFANNQFSGKIPDDAFVDMSSLKKVHLEKNRFTGTIPLSLTALPRLMELHLEENQFEGHIPEFPQKELQIFNASNNALDGPIPASLSKIDKNSFSGNKGLCGQPFDACKSSKKAPTLTAAVVAIVVVLAVIAIGAMIFLLHRRKQKAPSIEASPSNLKKKAATQDDSSHRSADSGGKRAENAKLTFLRDGREIFDLADLLRSSAEILGSGCFGSSYKAAIPTGAVMVVKRFKQMNNVGKEEFQEHMRRLGRLSHRNLLALIAYYYRKEEKLVVTDFVGRGSLALYLHGNRSLGQPSLDWPTRLKIVKGVAKGLEYLYKELPSLVTPHGHLKSSNVLLDTSFEPLLSDYGLIPVINQESAQEHMVAYKSPEYLQHDRITKKTDVWSFGILILEILTGQLPANFLKQGQGDDADLASWVNSIRENVSSEVFDKTMEASTGSEEEMFKLLNIGLSCCEGEVDKRLDIKETLERIGDVKES